MGGRGVRVKVLLGLFMSLMVAFVACRSGTSGDTGNTLSATATPIFPIHTIEVSNFQAIAVLPGTHGLVLYGAPLSGGNADASPGTVDSASALFYYDYSTKAIQQIATAVPAADGTKTNIVVAHVAGDWLVYDLEGVPVPAPQYSELWAVNLVTHQHTLLEQGTGNVFSGTSRLVGSFALNGSEIVWSVGNVADDGQTTWTIKDRPLPNGQLQSYPIPLSRTDRLVGPIAFDATSVLLRVSYENMEAPASSVDGLYVLSRDGGTIKRISGDIPPDASIASTYMVWDNPETMNLALYARQTGQTNEKWFSACIRPVFASDGTYLVCLDYADNMLRLVHVPSGQSISIGVARNDDYPVLDGDRLYWVQPSSATESGSHIDYISLPAQ